MGVASVAGTEARQNRTNDFSAFLSPQEQEEQKPTSVENGSPQDPAQSSQDQSDQLSEEEKAAVREFQENPDFQTLKKNIEKAAKDVQSKLGARKLDGAQMDKFVQQFTAGGFTVNSAIIKNLIPDLVSRFYKPNPEIIRRTLEQEYRKRTEELAKQTGGTPCAQIEKELADRIVQKRTHGHNSRTQTKNYVPFIAIAIPLASAFHFISAALDWLRQSGAEGKELKLKDQAEEKFLAKLKDLIEKSENGVVPVKDIVNLLKEFLADRAKAAAQSGRPYTDYLLDPITFIKTVCVATFLSATASQIYFTIRAIEADVTVPILEDLLAQYKCKSAPNEVERRRRGIRNEFLGPERQRPAARADQPHGSQQNPQIVQQPPQMNTPAQQQPAREMPSVSAGPPIEEPGFFENAWDGVQDFRKWMRAYTDDPFGDMEPIGGDITTFRGAKNAALLLLLMMGVGEVIIGLEGLGMAAGLTLGSEAGGAQVLEFVAARAATSGAAKEVLGKIAAALFGVTVLNGSSKEADAKDFSGPIGFSFDQVATDTFRTPALGDIKKTGEQVWLMGHNKELNTISLTKVDVFEQKQTGQKLVIVPHPKDKFAVTEYAATANVKVAQIPLEANPRKDRKTYLDLKNANPGLKDVKLFNAETKMERPQPPIPSPAPTPTPKP